MPGVLPVLNKGAVERAIRFGLAVGGNINRRSIFARKNYFYPDLPKGYQISQYEIPIVQGGEIPIVSPTRGDIKVQLTRAHLEEDAGKSLHEDFHGMSGIDLNRAGTPLLEIVSEPVMQSAEEAVAYAKALHSLVRWIDICDGNMQEGSFRCDANVSVRRPGAPLGTRREIKNLNSFRFLQQAIEYEIKWQIGTLEDGGKIQQATVLFDPDNGQTRVMRTKEDAHDYRYFPDPDLLPLEVGEAWIEEVRAGLPELQQAKRERFQSLYGLSPYDAATLTADRVMADYYEAIVKFVPDDPKLCANWVMGDVAAYLNKYEKFFDQPPVSARQLGVLLVRIKDGTISNKIAKDVFEQMCKKVDMFYVTTSALGKPRHDPRHGDDLADQIIEEKGLKQISDSGAIEKIVDQVITTNPQQVADYKSGKEKAFNSLVGQVMKASKGKANPAQVNEILKNKLG